MSVNQVTIVGRLGADPEIKTLDSGNTVANMSVATNETWFDKNGEKQEKTEWHRVVVWGKQADSVHKYLGKGLRAAITGKLQTRSWEDQDGQKRYATEVIANRVAFIDFKDIAKEGQTEASPQAGTGADVPNHAPGFDSNDEIPF